MLDANDAVVPVVHDDVEFDFLTKDDVCSLIQDGTNGLEASLADRMSSRGDLCFAARANNRLAGYVWIAFDQVDPESNRGASWLTGVGVSFPESTCFMYKGFVHREFRGRQIYGRLMSRAWPISCWSCRPSTPFSLCGRCCRPSCRSARCSGCWSGGRMSRGGTRHRGGRARPIRILAIHLLPATRGFLTAQATLLLPAFILAEATLSYVGLGFAPPAASWGGHAQRGVEY
jgi:hypothetical protein